MGDACWDPSSQVLNTGSLTVGRCMARASLHDGACCTDPALRLSPCASDRRSFRDSVQPSTPRNKSRYSTASGGVRADV